MGSLFYLCMLQQTTSELWWLFGK